MRINNIEFATHTVPRVILALLASVTAAYATPDSYYPVSGQLAMQSLGIGGIIFSNVVVKVGGIVTYPSGNVPKGIIDTYDPASGKLAVQAVTVGSTTYYNAVVTVTALDSVGGVIGADSYNGSALTIPRIQVGNTVYDSVVVAAGLPSVVSHAGGMPSAYADSYEALTGQLHVPVVQWGNNIYTNIVIRVSAGSVQFASSHTIRILHSFGFSDGATPDAGVFVDNAGNVYGTTYGGGTSNHGTVFRISASGSYFAYSFNGFPDGFNPQGTLIMDGAGNIYGTSDWGGTVGDGAVFKITSSGAESITYSFSSGADGGEPQSGMIMDGVGNLYGTTNIGGVGDNGTVFKLTPAGNESILYAFTGLADGAGPDTTPVMDGLGNLYGTTNGGGANGYGTVYKVTPSGTESVLHSFLGTFDGTSPSGPLIMDGAGNLYGTTGSGGFWANSAAYSGAGTVFKVTPAGVKSILYSFTGAADGGSPYGGLIMDGAGNLYGTTQSGGASNHGTIFELTPGGTESVLYSFSGGADGESPYAGLTMDGAGNFYTTTRQGGAGGYGTVIRIAAH